MIYGMVLAETGNIEGTWVRVDGSLNPVPFDESHGTWAGIHPLTVDGQQMVELPITWTGAEVISTGRYAGRPVWWTADEALDGLHIHPAFMYRGKAYPLQIASYIASKDVDGLPSTRYTWDNPLFYWNNVRATDVRRLAMLRNRVDDDGRRIEGWHAYSIYAHFLIARLILTEFGTPSAMRVVADGVPWRGYDRMTWRGIHDIYGMPNSALYVFVDGLDTIDGNYRVRGDDGEMVDTGVPCLNGDAWTTMTKLGVHGGVDFGDLFIAEAENYEREFGSFSSSQAFYKGCAYMVVWNEALCSGLFKLTFVKVSRQIGIAGFRLARYAMEV